jgi:hypothetical protein
VSRVILCRIIAFSSYLTTRTKKLPYSVGGIRYYISIPEDISPVWPGFAAEPHSIWSMSQQTACQESEGFCWNRALIDQWSVLWYMQACDRPVIPRTARAGQDLLFFRPSATSAADPAI